MTTIEITETIARKVLDVIDAGLVSGIGEPIPGQMCVEAAVCYALGLPHGDEPQCVSPALRSLKIRLNDSNWSSDQARAKGLRRLAVAQLGSRGAFDERGFVKRLVDHAIRVSTPKGLRIAAELQTRPHRTALLDAANRCETEGTRTAAEAAHAAANAVAYAAANAVAEAVANAYAYTAAYTAADAAANAAYAAANAVAEAAANAVAEAAAYTAADAAANAAYAAANAVANAYAYTAAAYAASAYARDKSLAEYAEAVVQILIDLKAPGCQWLPLTEADQ